ncbi:glycoside hydrolase [Aureobasidium pullulans]|nr:glycoside hydrolase [Aureobasidium pullulans]THX98996.1 glycoside hydrolase [Aureobasidium pullulans]
MLTHFFRLVAQVNNDEITIEDAAAVLSSLMTDDEHLALLQGNRSLTQYLSDNKASPYPASVVSRVGVPGIHIVDGVRQAFFTEFPSPLGRAASFDCHLEELIGEAIGIEVQAHGGNVYSGICLNVTRRSDWGRAHESYGEDPFVISRMGSAAARGARKHVMVAVRHFAMNSMEVLREDGKITCDEKTMNELFLQHFKEVLYESGAEAVVSAGNLVNGVACAENPALLNGILRQRWKLDNLVVASDCTWPVKSGTASIKAGLDLELPFSAGGRTQAVENALEHGTLNWSDIQVMTERILRCQLRYYCRTIQMPTPDPEKIRCQRHIGLARRSVAESMVLLKNDNNFLPLNGASQIKLSVLGVLADRVSTAHQFDTASHAQGPPGTSPLEELRKRHNLSVEYMDGSQKTHVINSALAANVVVLFIRPSSKSEPSLKRRRFSDYFKSRKERSLSQQREAMTSFRDRSHLTLDSSDLETAKAVLSVAGQKTVVVIEAGTSVTIPTFVRQKATAILFSSYGCRQYGKGLRDVLFGEQEPSGRLPFVLPDTEQQLLGKESTTSSHEFKYDDKWGYRKLQQEQQKPAYPFGFGLGYSSFTLNSIWCSHPIIKSSFDMTVNATNIGTRASAVVIQIYASRRSRRDSASVSIISRSLIGFAKEVIKPGENSEIAVTCRISPLAEFRSSSSKMVVAEGEYDLFVSQYEGDVKALKSAFQILNEVDC